jgi:SAM-dependent methyltransferase
MKVQQYLITQKTPNNFEQVVQVCRQYYENSLAEFGDSPQGVNWADACSQNLRFQIMSEIDNLNGKIVHDVGCGLGHLFDFLSKKAINCEYVGSDISSSMITCAKGRIPNQNLYVADILQNPVPEWMAADYLFTSGLFYVKNSINKAIWTSFMETMLKQMFKLARKGIAFNMLTSYVDYKDKKLFYLHPKNAIEFCVNNLSKRVTLRHDYPLWEYTVYVYKDGHAKQH